MEQVRRAEDRQSHDWVVKRHLSPDALKEYVHRLAIDRAQVVAITEPRDGAFTLIYEPDDEQVEQLQSEEGQVEEVLDTLFGPAVTPEQVVSEKEAETVVVSPNIPTLPGIAEPINS